MCYGDIRGDRDILETICAKLKTENKLNITADNICIVPGARFGFYLTSLCFLRPKEEAIMIGGPTHPCLVNSNNAVGAVTVWNNLRKSDCKIDLEDLRKKVNRKTRLLCLMNPTNPTGRVLKKEELQQVAVLARKHNLIVLSDEIFEDLIYEGEPISFASLDEDTASRTITLFSPSKEANFTGLRVAYLTSPKEMMKKFEFKMGQMLAHTDRIAQMSLQGFLTDAKPWLADLKDHLIKMRNYCMKRIEYLPEVRCCQPEAGRFLFLDLKFYRLNSLKIAEYLKVEAKVEVKPGILFGPGGEGHIRISFATSQSILEEAFHRIENGLKNLPNS